ncbi:MAG: hypothetical protein Q7J27_08865 [Syntrophales bacterium]|nr:hypothetical protein [Syntrophales bacterium]
MTETAFKEAVSLRQAGETELIKLKRSSKKSSHETQNQGKM